jgi:GTP-binding protein EngB required for normal cell division
MVCGETGVGKSTFINILLNEKKSLNGIGFSQTSKIIKYTHSKFNLSFFDTPGFTLGKKDEIEICVNKIKELKCGLKDEKNEIHLIFYLINSQSGRTLKGIEIEFLNFLINLDIKIYFILTRVIDEKKGNQFKKEMENSFDFIFKNENENENVSKKLKEKIFLVDLKTKKGFVEILTNLYAEFFFYKVECENFNFNNNENNENENNNNNENKINEIKTLVKHSIFFKNLNSKSDFLLRKKAIAYSLILSYSLGNFICGSNLSFTSDKYICTSLQLAMIGSITLLYKKYLNKNKNNNNNLKTIEIISTKTIESLGIHISDERIKTMIKEIVNYIKYLPYFGEIINNIINGSISGISTFVIGYNLVKKFEDEIKNNYEVGLYLEAIENFNDAVEGIKKLKERFYFETN